MNWAKHFLSEWSLLIALYNTKKGIFMQSIIKLFNSAC